MNTKITAIAEALVILSVSDGMNSDNFSQKNNQTFPSTNRVNDSDCYSDDDEQKLYIAALLEENRILKEENAQYKRLLKNKSKEKRILKKEIARLLEEQRQTYKKLDAELDESINEVRQLCKEWDELPDWMDKVYDQFVNHNHFSSSDSDETPASRPQSSEKRIEKRNSEEVTPEIKQTPRSQTVIKRRGGAPVPRSKSRKIIRKRDSLQDSERN